MQQFCSHKLSTQKLSLSRFNFNDLLMRLNLFIYVFYGCMYTAIRLDETAIRTYILKNVLFQCRDVDAISPKFVVLSEPRPRRPHEWRFNDPTYANRTWTGLPHENISEHKCIPSTMGLTNITYHAVKRRVTVGCMHIFVRYKMFIKGHWFLTEDPHTLTRRWWNMIGSLLFFSVPYLQVFLRTNNRSNRTVH